MQRVENLAQQVKQIGFPAAQPPTVQIDIDMSAGCTNSTSSQEINLYKVFSAVKYINEVVTRNVCGLCCLNNHARAPGFHSIQNFVVTDLICEVETIGNATLYGAGVIEVVVLESKSRNGSVFQYLSEVDIYCSCYYWAPNQAPNQPSGAFCTRIVTRCPYKKQPSIIHSLVL